MLWTPAVKPSVPEHASKELNEPSEATVSRLGNIRNEEHSPVTLAQPESSTPKAIKRGGLRQYKTNQGFPQANDTLGPLFLRQSDNQLVHLHCCVIGCNKAYFRTVTSLMSHIASSLHHGFGKGFLKDHADAIEKCGRIPGSDEEFVQVQPRDTVKRTKSSSGFKGSTSRDTMSSENAPRDSIPTSSLVRVNRAFGSNINESINGFPSSDPSRSITGMELLRLEDEEELVFISANDVINQDMPSNGLSSADSTPVPAAAVTATDTLFSDMGPAVQIKQEKEEPMAMWSDTVPNSAMSMPAENANNLVRHDRST